MITWFAVKHWWWWWWWFKKSLDADTIRLIWQILPKEVWHYLISNDNALPNGSAGKMLKEIDKQSVWELKEWWHFIW